MSAAAARRRKQLAARQQQAGAAEQPPTGGGSVDIVQAQLDKMFADHEEQIMDEAVAYEALQLAQSAVRKKIHSGADQFAAARDLCYQISMKLLQKDRVSVASQLMQLLADILRETHCEETTEWLQRLQELHTQHGAAMERIVVVASPSTIKPQEVLRLQRLQRDWLLLVLKWSNDVGSTKFGANILHDMLADHCWKLTLLMKKQQQQQSATTESSSSAAAAAASAADSAQEGEEEEDDDDDEIAEMQCDAVQHMCMAEQPLKIAAWLKELPAPTQDEIKAGHMCPPALRDALLTRALLLLAAVQNLRDANILLRYYIDNIEERDLKDLQKSYTNKEDGKAPSHVMFGCMLLRILEKDTRTGPLFSWLMRSFKRELDGMYKPVAVHSYVTKIGKLYFNIQPPPNMMSMMENMMNMMGGGGGGAGGGMPPINPAMMQAAMQQLQQGGMM